MALNDLINKLRSQAPLIQNLTNYVSVAAVANILLSIGASPLMSHAIEEQGDINSIISALVLNIGTLDKSFLNSVQVAQDYALFKNKIIVLDPVGAGASEFRTKAALAILERGVGIVRGNASEIMALMDNTHKTKGVDSLMDSHSAIEAARSISQRYSCCVVVSGKVDIVFYQEQLALLNRGHELLTKVTGMGCALTAVIAAFATVESDVFYACKAALTVFGIAAERAAIRCNGTGSFYSAMLDELFNFEITADAELSLSV